MRIQLDPTAADALRALPPATKKRMKEALAKLAKDASGRAVGLDVKRLDARAPWPAFRLALGDWRAAWFIRGDAVQVVRIFHRSEGYGWLDRLHP